MILGFAHLTRSARQVDDAIARFQDMGFTLQSLHRDIPSATAKWSLLTRPAKTHHLALLRGTPAIEVVSHDTGSVAQPSMLDLQDGRVQLRVRDLERERRFFSDGMPCDVLENRLEIRGAFPAWRTSMTLVADAAAPTQPPLDVEGFSCLAFYSNNVTEDVQRLVSLGARDATEEFGITLDGRNMRIVMLRSPGGTILELVKVNRQ